MPKIKGVHNDTYSIDSVGKTYTFTKSYRGHDSFYYAIDELGANNTIVLHGIARSNISWEAINAYGDDVTIRIAPDGVIRGQGHGIACNGAAATVVNEGRIVVPYDHIGVLLYGRDAELTNKGRILSEGGAIALQGEHAQATNAKGGLIRGDDHAVLLGGGTGDDLKFVNHGKVEAPGGYAVMALIGHESHDTIINDGRIVGSILLGDGNDKVDTRGGRITGTIEGGAGDDRLITDKAGHRLIESEHEGFDTVRSTVTYTLPANVEKLVLLGTKNIDGKGTANDDILVGNAGNNVLFGHGGADRLDGRAGNDVLKGGAGADTFVFETGYGRDIVTLFEGGVDKVEVSGWKAITSFDDLIDNHARNHGGDVWIVAGKDRLIIEDTRKIDLDADDFIF